MITEHSRTYQPESLGLQDDSTFPYSKAIHVIPDGNFLELNSGKSATRILEKFFSSKNEKLQANENSVFLWDFFSTGFSSKARLQKLFEWAESGKTITCVDYLDPEQVRTLTSPIGILNVIDESIGSDSFVIRNCQELAAPSFLETTIAKDSGSSTQHISVITISPKNSQRAEVNSVVKANVGKDYSQPGHLTSENVSFPTKSFVVRSQKPAKILIMKLDHRGDFRLAIPAIQKINEAFPTAEFTLVCGPWNEQLAREFPWVNTVKTLDFFAENPSLGHGKTTRQSTAEFKQMMEGETYDLALDLRVDPDTRGLLKVVSASTRAGFGTKTEFPFLDLCIPTFNPTADFRTQVTFIPATQFHCYGDAVHEGFQIRSVPTPKGIKPLLKFVASKIMPQTVFPYTRTPFVIGPSVTLPRGTYEVLPVINFGKQKTPLVYSIRASSNSGAILEGPINTSGVAETVVIKDAASTIRYSLYLDPLRQHKFTFGGLKLSKFGNATDGLHQTEMMHAIVAAAVQRLNFTLELPDKNSD